MNWEAIGAIADIVGAIAVLATLIYLALQIRQNSRSLDQQNIVARAQILQQRADSVMHLVAPAQNDEKTFDLVTKILGTNGQAAADFDPNEKIRVGLVLHPLRAHLENAFLQYQQGFLPEDVYREVMVPLCLTYGPSILAIGLPMTTSFRNELTRILPKEPEAEENEECKI